MKCPNCGKEIANDSVFCEYCGEKVVPVAAKKKLPLWLIIVGALIVVALIVIFCYDSSPESQPLPDEVTPVEEVTDSTSGASIVHGSDSLDAVASQPAESKQVAEDEAAKQAKIEADKKAQEEAEKKAKADAEKAKKEQAAREQAQQAEVEDEEVEDVIFKVVEVMPTFPGGEEAFRNYLSNNLRYPVEAQENGLQGRTICQFVVEKDGSISDVQVVRSSGTDALDKEAVRVLRAMPRWRPGSQRGRKVRVQYTAPINFRLQ